MTRAVVALLALVALAAEPAPRDVSGRWAMAWQTRKHGLQKSGWLIIAQKGATFDVTLKGDGELHATGSVSGNDVHVTGRKMLMPFSIDATVADDAVMHGAVKVSTVVKPFTATRE